MNRHATSNRVGAGLPARLRAFACVAIVIAWPFRAFAADDAQRYTGELFEAINAYRETKKLPALAPNPTLDRLAAEHSAAMAKRRRMSHDGFDARFKASGFRRCVENVGWNAPSGAAQLAAWRDSAPHDANLLEPNVKAVGLAERDRYVTMFACG